MLVKSKASLVSAEPSARLTAQACDVTPALKRAECPSTFQNASQTLQALKEQFCQIAKVSDDYAVNAAKLVKQMRDLVNTGAAGQGVTWYSWAFELGMPKQRVQRYIRIADAKNPQAMRDEFLRRDRERQKRFRGKAKEMEPERARLIKWARKAPLFSVTKLLASIEKQPSNAITHR